MGEILNVSVHMKEKKEYFILPVSVLLITLLLVSTFHFVKNVYGSVSLFSFPIVLYELKTKKVQIPSRLKTFFFHSGLSGKLENAASLSINLVEFFFLEFFGKV